jgi:WD40 repeat protein
MGVVYKARQMGLNRLVALKMLRAGDGAGGNASARFYREAEAAGRMRHPNLVQIYEVGSHAGLPFLSLEYVEGGSLAEHLTGVPLPIRPAVALVETLARGMQYAHERGIVHRDLKPANILLQMADSRWQEARPSAMAVFQSAIPKITDFGLAKLLDEDVRLTRTGLVLGTPSYMAPEQVLPGRQPVGPAADVYALGAILYELLSGRPPFVGETSLDTAQQVVHAEPVPPRRLNAKIPRDVETIILKCLSKEPARRYPTALALADDLQRWRDGKPIQARPVNGWERGWRWAKRKPAVASLLVVSSLAGLTLVGGGVGLWYHGQLREEYQKTQSALQTAETHQYFHHIALAHAGWRDGNLVPVDGLLDGCPRDRRNWEWHYLRRLCHADALTLDTRGITSLACSPDGTRLATGTSDGAVQIWNATTGEEILATKGHADGVHGLAFSPDGSRLASASRDKTVKEWDVATGREVRCFPHPTIVWSVTYSPDGRRLVSGSSDGDNAIRVWDMTTAKEVLPPKRLTSHVFSVAYSPEGTRLAAADWSESAMVWDATTGQPVRALKGWHVAFSPDGNQVASAGRDGAVRVWDAAADKESLLIVGGSGAVQSLAYSPDGTRLVTASSDGTIKLLDATTGQEVRTLKGHTEEVRQLAFHPDGTRLVSASFNGRVKVWDVMTIQEARLLTGHPRWVEGVAFDPDRKWLASASRDETVKIWDVATGQEVRTLKGHTNQVHGLAFSPDGKSLASASWDQSVKVWDLTSEKEPRTFRHSARVWSVAYSPDGSLLASGSEDGAVKVWDTRTGQENVLLEGHGVRVYSVVFSPQGKWLASGARDNLVKIWDTQQGRAGGRGAPLLALKGHTSWVYGVAYSPDGKWLTSASDDGTVRLWNAATGQEVRTLKGHNSHVFSAMFNVDATRLASASADGTVKLWDVATGMEILTLRGHSGLVRSVVFDPDGKRLASAGWDGTIKIWDARPLADGNVEDEAVHLLDFLVAKPLSQADIRQHLDSSQTIRAEVRQRALALMARYREETDPERYHQSAWAIIRQPNLNTFPYHIALCQAKSARRLAPEQVQYMTTLGTAQYRAGQYAQAQATLEQADLLHRTGMAGVAFPVLQCPHFLVTLWQAQSLHRTIAANLAFLAMTHHHLGETDKAKNCLNRLEETTKVRPSVEDEDAQAFLREAQARIEWHRAAPAQPGDR